MNGAVDGIVADSSVTAGGHTLNVTTGTKALTRTSEYDTAYLGIELCICQLLRQRRGHLSTHGVTRLWTVERQRQNAFV